MDAKEFIRERERMLDSLGRTDGRCCGVFCNKCYLHSPDVGCLYNTKKAVDIVEKWSKEHPKRTYLDVLLEAFPNTLLKTDGTPAMCPHHLGFEHIQGCYGTPCIDCCCTDCWHREYNGGK